MRLAGNVACIAENRNTYRRKVANPERKRPLENPCVDVRIVLNGYKIKSITHSGLHSPASRHGQQRALLNTATDLLVQ
jgi:hypothetical protein